MDLAHALGEYLDYLAVERGSSPNTVAAYRRDLTRYLDWLAAEKIVEPADVTRPDVERHLEALAEVGLSPASLERAASAIKGFHRFMVLEGVCDELPTADMPLPAKPSRLPDVLSREQAAALLDQPFSQTPTGLRDRAVLEVLYGCGLRASELCGLDRRAVLLDEELLRVFGKGSKERLVPILGTAAASLRAYLEEGRGALVGRMPTPAVFLNVHGGRLSRQSVHAICEKYGRVAGIKGLHPHTLRHSFATHMLKGGSTPTWTAPTSAASTSRPTPAPTSASSLWGGAPPGVGRRPTPCHTTCGTAPHRAGRACVTPQRSCWPRFG